MSEINERKKSFKKPIIIGAIIVVIILVFVLIMCVIGTVETPSTQEVNSLIQQTAILGNRDLTLLNADVNSSSNAGSALYSQCESTVSNLTPIITKLKTDLSNSTGDQNVDFLKLELDRAQFVQDLAYVLPRYQSYLNSYNASQTGNAANADSLKLLKKQIDEFLKSSQLLDAQAKGVDIMSLITTIESNPSLEANYFGSSASKQISDAKEGNKSFLQIIGQLQTMSNNLQVWIGEAPSPSSLSEQKVQPNNTQSTSQTNTGNSNNVQIQSGDGSNGGNSNASADPNAILELLNADQLVQGVVAGTNVNWDFNNGYDGGKVITGEETYGGSSNTFGIKVSLDSSNKVSVTEIFDGKITGYYNLTKNGDNLSGTFTNASNSKVSKATFCI